MDVSKAHSGLRSEVGPPEWATAPWASRRELIQQWSLRLHATMQAEDYCLSENRDQHDTHQEETCSHMIQNEHLRSKSTYDAHRRIFLFCEHRRDLVHKTWGCSGRTKYEGHGGVSSEERLDKELNLIRSIYWKVEASKALIACQSSSIWFQCKKKQPNIQYAMLSKALYRLI